MASANNISEICNNCVNSTCNLPPGYCFINGQCFQDGDGLYTCLMCDSFQNQFEWSYDSKCSPGDRFCSDRQFLEQHVCDQSIINAFYQDFRNAITTLFNYKNCSTLACQPGFFFSTSANSGANGTTPNLFSCCPGHFCPEGQICMIPCRDAAYCPSPLIPKNGFCFTDAQCTPNAPVQFDKYGCGGSSVEGFCASQSYCPNSSTKISCENLGSVYCPSGVMEPVVCPLGFTCQNGTLKNDIPWRAVMAVVLILFGLTIAFYFILFLANLLCSTKKYLFCSFCSTNVNNRNANNTPGSTTVAHDESCARACGWGFGSKTDTSKHPLILTHTHTCSHPHHHSHPHPHFALSSARSYATFAVCNFRDPNTPIGDYFIPSSNQTELNNNDIIVELVHKGIDIILENAVLDIPTWDPGRAGFRCSIKAEQINAIMGQSGCGKTSLLYAIQGRKGLKSGTIALDKKHPLEPSLSDFVGYVPQEDIMHSNLTVFETVHFSARARRVEDNSIQIENDVKTVLERLGMTEKSDTRTEKLSGGEKKRVNIAMEIVACPKVLLLDEPTSGLNSVICDKVFDLLTSIKQNRLYPVNIILTIHQPSYELFQKIDHLILLNPNCYLAYQGPRRDALRHLQRRIDVSQLGPDEKRKIYKSRNDCDRCIYALRFYPNENHVIHRAACRRSIRGPTVFSLRPTNKHSILMPIVYLIHRSGVQMCRRDYVTEAVYGLSFFLLGLVIGGLFRNQTQSCDLKTLPAIYFMITLAFGIAMCIASQRLFGMEMVDKTFIRETRNYYHPIQYWFAKSLIDLIHLILYPLLFLSMFYIEVMPRSSFGQYYSVLLVMSFACSGIGQFVSVACNRTENCYLAATLIALISCLISGFNPTKREKLHGLVYFSFSRHVQRQLFIYDTEKYVQNASTISMWNTQIDQLRFHYSFGDDEQSVVGLVLIGIMFRLLTIAFLYGRSEYRSKLRFYWSKLFYWIGYEPR